MTLTLVQRGSWPGWAPGAADIYLDSEAGAAYLSMMAAYRRETGRSDGEIAEPVGGLRTPAIDAAMLAAFRSRDKAQMAYWNLDPASKAPPGLDSPHNSGLCVDVYAGGWSWFSGSNGANPRRFGFRFTLLASNDVHHLQYFPGTATAALDVHGLDGGGATPDPEQEEDEFMVQQINYDKQVLTIQDAGKQSWFLVDTRSGAWQETTDLKVATLWVSKHGDSENVTYAEATGRKQAAADVRFGGKAPAVDPVKKAGTL